MQCRQIELGVVHQSLDIPIDAAQDRGLKCLLSAFFHEVIVFNILIAGLRRRMFEILNKSC